MPPAPARPLARRLLLAAGLLVVGTAVAPGEASAQCAPDPAGSGNPVNCTGNDADGFNAGADVNLTVTVETGATVSNPGADVIVLNTGNTVTVETGAIITATGANADGIVAGDTNTIGNGGTILLQGDGGVGIDAANNGFVTNSGFITGTVDNTIGVRVGTGAVDGMVDGNEEVVNDGSITLNGAGVVGIDANSNNEVVNNGTVSVTGANARGIRLNAGGNELTNTGLVLVSGDGAVGVEATGGNTLTLGGLVRSAPTTAGMQGAAIDLSAGGANIVEITGSVEGYADPGFTTPGSAILGGGGVDTIVSRGTLFGTVQLGGGDDVLDLRTGSAFTSGGTIDGGAGANDQILLQGDTSGFVLDLDDVMNFEALTVNSAAGTGIWGLSGTGVFANGVMLNAGTLQLAQTATLGGGTNFTMVDGSTLSIVVDPVTGAAGQLVVDGVATLPAVPNNTSLVLAPTSPLRSASYTVLRANGGIVGSFSNIPANTPLLSFTLVQTAMQIQLQVLRNSYTGFAQTTNQRAVASYLDMALVAGALGDDLAAALAFVETFSAAELPTFFESLHAEAYDAHTGQMARLGRVIANVAIEPRLWCKPALYGLRPGNRDDVPCGTRGWSTWIRPFTGFGDRDPDSDFLSSDHQDQGIVGGVDWRPTRHWLVTLFAGLSSTDLDVDGAGEGDVDTLEVGMASAFRMAGARARAAFGYGRGDHENDREVEFSLVNRTAESEYNSDRIHTLLELAWEFAFGNWRVEPIGRVDVTWLREEEFGETNAGDLSLDVDERENTIVSTSFGGRVAYRHFQNPFSDRGPRWAQGTWTPQVSARWRSTWTGADRELESRLQGAPASLGTFTTEAEDDDQGVDVGAHVVFQPHGSGGSLAIGYDGYIGDGRMDHSFGAKLELVF